MSIRDTCTLPANLTSWLDRGAGWVLLTDNNFKFKQIHDVSRWHSPILTNQEFKSVRTNLQTTKICTPPHWPFVCTNNFNVLNWSLVPSSYQPNGVGSCSSQQNRTIVYPFHHRYIFVIRHPLIKLLPSWLICLSDLIFPLRFGETLSCSTHLLYQSNKSIEIKYLSKNSIWPF